MSSSIRFLETLGGDPALGRMSIAHYAAAVASLQIEDAQQQALLERDPHTLNGLLGGRERMVCGLMLPEQDEPGEQEEKPDEEQQEDNGEEAPSAHSLLGD